MILTIKFTNDFIKLCFNSQYGNITTFEINKNDFFKSCSKYTYNNLENYVYSKQFESEKFDRIADFLSSVYVTKLIINGGIQC